MRVFLALLALVLVSQVAAADVYIRGYTRKDGTYVQPHYRSDPDGNRFNNFSTRGNINPYTGERGTVDPYRVPSNPYGLSPSYGGGNKPRW